jgi:hypothetical protein
VAEERQEVLAGGELDVLVVQVRDQAGQIGERDAAEHIGVQGNLHQNRGVSSPGNVSGVR